MAIALKHVRSTHWIAYHVGLCRTCWAKDVKFWPTYRTMHVRYMSKLTVIQRNLTTLDRQFNKLPTLAQQWLLSVFFDSWKQIFWFFEKHFNITPFTSVYKRSHEKSKLTKFYQYKKRVICSKEQTQLCILWLYVNKTKLFQIRKMLP